MKSIPNFPDYSVDKKGNVYSEKYGKVRKLKLINNRGYLHVNLYQNGKHFNRQVHRLVLETFIGPRPGGMQTRHRDGIKAHNELSNLKWDTLSNNQLDRARHGTSNRGERCGSSVLTEEQVRFIRNYPKYEGYKSSLLKLFGIATSTLNNVLSRRSWNHIK